MPIRRLVFEGDMAITWEEKWRRFVLEFTRASLLTRCLSVKPIFHFFYPAHSPSCRGCFWIRIPTLVLSEEANGGGDGGPRRSARRGPALPPPPALLLPRRGRPRLARYQRARTRLTARGRRRSVPAAAPAAGLPVHRAHRTYAIPAACSRFLPVSRSRGLILFSLCLLFGTESLGSGWLMVGRD